MKHEHEQRKVKRCNTAWYLQNSKLPPYLMRIRSDNRLSASFIFPKTIFAIFTVPGLILGCTFSRQHHFPRDPRNPSNKSDIPNHALNQCFSTEQPSSYGRKNLSGNCRDFWKPIMIKYGQRHSPLQTSLDCPLQQIPYTAAAASNI